MTQTIRQKAREVALALHPQRHPNASKAFHGMRLDSFARYVEDLVAYYGLSDAACAVCMVGGSGVVRVELGDLDPVEFAEFKRDLLNSVEPHRPAPLMVEVKRV